jgi:hypothetical protein
MESEGSIETLVRFYRSGRDDGQETEMSITVKRVRDGRPVNQGSISGRCKDIHLFITFCQDQKLLRPLLPAVGGTGFAMGMLLASLSA